MIYVLFHIQELNAVKKYQNQNRLTYFLSILVTFYLEQCTFGNIFLHSGLTVLGLLDCNCPQCSSAVDQWKPPVLGQEGWGLYKAI